MSGENLDPLLQNPLLKASIRSSRSAKTVLNFFINLILIGSHTPLYYIHFTFFIKDLVINSLILLSLTAMPLGGFRGFSFSDLKILPTTFHLDPRFALSKGLFKLELL